MKALRSWMRENEKLREAFTDTQERAIPANVGDKMRDIIMVMADALGGIKGKIDSTALARFSDLDLIEDSEIIHYIDDIATTAQEKVRDIVR
ncbi:MAG: hypothetical protein KAJ09_05065 [Deltaproteobacteria bacterium]|nr:hypothetical protein [Deltaproteobacteria bacterium]